MDLRHFPVPFLLSLSVFALPAHADIVGGEDVRPKDPIRSSTAALYEPSPDGRGGALCTASVIGEDTAVTAAHCITPGGPKPVMIFGNDVHSKDVVARPVTGEVVNKKWVTHAGKGMDEGEIALVKFPGGLPEGYQPAQMAGPDDKLRKGEKATLAGYGISDAKAQTGAGHLRKTSVAIDDPRQGKTEMILDQSRGRGACHGDSGGPAYVRSGGHMVLAGVTNRSYPNTAPDDCAHKVVYTKVGSYRRWIDQGEKRLHSRGDDSGTGELSARRGSTGLLAAKMRRHVSHIRSGSGRIGQRGRAGTQRRASHRRVSHRRRMERPTRHRALHARGGRHRHRA